jgi:Predicted RNA-binding protein (contains PUA domain)
MARHALSKKDLKALHEKLKSNNLWGAFLENSPIEVEEHKNRKCFSIGGTLIAMEDKEFLPSLELINALKPEAHFLTVDDGAVPHIMNGAKLFGKGVVEVGGAIEEGSMVFIRDLKGRYIAVGKSLKNGDDLKASREGAAAEVILIPGKNPCQDTSGR